ncbi:DNA helicase 60 [Plasmodium sp. gorilla clade G2]|uniref:DNA helicase 60 n=1 Tax=Plasmodium sp. gorilla clade G2 TaxID=880535 RepID=UPI000D229265|nr:DNA helicase 60 [Plasmodium sp. gorilla clade G2]SOV16919.1 DNA helicase 60 [Plasmodium sp. gorilla clade G2]
MRRNLLKFTSINCKRNDCVSLSSNFFFIKNRSYKYITVRGKIGTNVISDKDNCNILNRGQANVLLSKKNICTENKIKQNDTEFYINEKVKDNMQNDLETSNNYNEMDQNGNGNKDNQMDNMMDNHTDNHMHDNTSYDNTLYDNTSYDNTLYDNDSFDRYQKKRDEIGENGFVQNRRYENYDKRKKSKTNYSYDNDYNQDSRNKRNMSYSDRYENLGSQLKDIEWDNVKYKIERQNLYSNINNNNKANDQNNDNSNNEQTNRLSKEDIQNELKKNNIYINKDGIIHNVINKFSDVCFHESILNYLNNKFNEPTAIQKITWPIALSGKDLIGVAETGSGKTLAFVLPCFMHILKHKEIVKNNNEQISQTNNLHQEEEVQINNHHFNEDNDNNDKNNININSNNNNNNNINSYDYDMNTSERVSDTYGLILLPTRELCLQVLDEIKAFEKNLPIKSVAVYGGVPKYYQINNLKKGADIIVATPGRLLDFLENGIINLLKCIYVVIDEADRLLDMGFEKQLRKIMTQVNKNKQLLFLTATWPEQVRKLAYDFCSYDPVKIQIGKNELTANKNIEQNVIISSSIDMKKKLLDWLKENYENNKILIFCDTKRNCDNLCKELRYHQYNALSIHGDKQQRERDRILNNYKTDRCNILVATDVASRGLDIKNISVVINYDIPNTIEDYIHRIGRTGRAGKKGKSILFFSYDYYIPQKLKFAKELIKLLNKTNQTVPAQLREIAYSR